MGVRGELFSARVKSKNDRRTYFFNVKENRNNDVFVTVVESKKAGEGESFDRHQVVVFEEDLQLFRKGIDTVLEYLESRDGGRRRGGSGGHRRPSAGRVRDGQDRDGTLRDGAPGERKPTRLRRRTPDEALEGERGPGSDFSGVGDAAHPQDSDAERAADGPRQESDSPAQAATPQDDERPEET